MRCAAMVLSALFTMALVPSVANAVDLQWQWLIEDRCFEAELASDAPISTLIVNPREIVGDMGPLSNDRPSLAMFVDRIEVVVVSRAIVPGTVLSCGGDYCESLASFGANVLGEVTIIPQAGATTSIRMFPMGAVVDMGMLSTPCGQDGNCTLPPIYTRPCPADINDDDVVTADDLTYFLDLWFMGSLCADLYGDQNGMVTSDDIFAFLDRWFAGCGGT